MQFLQSRGMLLAAAIAAGGADAQESTAVKELIPTGKLRAGVVFPPAASVEEAMALLRAGKADAFALSRDSLPPLAAQLPGSCIVDGGFQQTAIAIAVPKNRPNALAYVTAFLQQAKASGSVRRALDKAGFPNEPVAP